MSVHVEGYSREIEVNTEDAWDPTYEQTEHAHGIIVARTCQRCGALVDGAALDQHNRHHVELGRAVAMHGPIGL